MYVVVAIKLHSFVKRKNIAHSGESVIALQEFCDDIQNPHPKPQVFSQIFWIVTIKIEKKYFLSLIKTCRAWSNSEKINYTKKDSFKTNKKNLLHIYISN